MSNELLVSSTEYFRMRNAVLIFVLIAIGASGCANRSQQSELETFERGNDYDYQLSSLAGASNYRLTLTED